MQNSSTQNIEVRSITKVDQRKRWIYLYGKILYADKNIYHIFVIILEIMTFAIYSINDFIELI